MDVFDEKLHMEQPFDEVSRTINASISQYSSNPYLAENVPTTDEDINDLYVKAKGEDVPIVTKSKLDSLVNKTSESYSSYNRMIKMLKDNGSISAEASGGIAFQGIENLQKFFVDTVKEQILVFCKTLKTVSQTTYKDLDGKLGVPLTESDIPTSGAKTYLNRFFQSKDLGEKRIAFPYKDTDELFENSTQSFSLISQDKDYMARLVKNLKGLGSAIRETKDFIKKSDVLKGELSVSKLKPFVSKMDSVFDECFNRAVDADIFVWDRQNYKLNVITSELEVLGDENVTPNGINKGSRKNKYEISQSKTSNDVIITTIKCKCLPQLTSMFTLPYGGGCFAYPDKSKVRTLYSVPSPHETPFTFYDKVRGFIDSTKDFVKNRSDLSKEALSILIQACDDITEMSNLVVAGLTKIANSGVRNSATFKACKFYSGLLTRILFDSFNLLSSMSTTVTFEVIRKVEIYEQTNSLSRLFLKLMENHK